MGRTRRPHCLKLSKITIEKNIRCVFADTQNEHQMTYDYLDYIEDRLDVKIERIKANFDHLFERKRKWVTKHWPKDIAKEALPYIKPTGSLFLDLAIIKGRFPSRMAQFCTTELKSIPLDSYIMKLCLSGQLVESWQGTRREESVKRRGLLEIEDMDGWVVRRPILKWTAQEVVDFVRRLRGKT